MEDFELPDKFSTFITMALEDIQKHDVNMSTWLRFEDDSMTEVCTVCLAGAVMANRLMDTSESFPYGCSSDYMFRALTANNRPLQKALQALDFFRGGSFYSALSCWGSVIRKLDWPLTIEADLQRVITKRFPPKKGEYAPFSTGGQFEQYFMVMDQGSLLMEEFIEVMTELNQILIDNGL